MKTLAALAIALALVAPAGLTPLEAAGDYLASRQQADGGFAEREGRSDPSLTAWTVLALHSAGRQPQSPERALEYLGAQPYPTASDLALRVLALHALGADATALGDRLASLRRADGRIGPLVNSTAWSVIALRALGRRAPPESVRYLIRRQRPSGGWSWLPGAAPDTNDTAAVIQALCAAGVQGRPIRRGLAYLRRSQARSGGFALVPGRTPDAQSTAWAIQAFLAARRQPPKRAYTFLLSLYRGDGSFRYSRRYATTPVFVTAQVVPALARKPFPLR